MKRVDYLRPTAEGSAQGEQRVEEMEMNNVVLPEDAAQPSDFSGRHFIAAAQSGAAYYRASRDEVRRRLPLQASEQDSWTQVIPPALLVDKVPHQCPDPTKVCAVNKMQDFH